jgi:hypothetical protein
MVVFGKYLVVVTQSASLSVNTYRFDMVAGSWQDVGGSVNRIAVLRGRLYGVQANGNIWTVPDATLQLGRGLYYIQVMLHQCLLHGLSLMGLYGFQYRV